MICEDCKYYNEEYQFCKLWSESVSYDFTCDDYSEVEDE